jgi:hypothetical protein
MSRTQTLPAHQPKIVAPERALKARIKHRAVRAAAQGFAALEAIADAWIERDRQSDLLMARQDEAVAYARTMGPLHGALKDGRTGEHHHDYHFPEPVHPTAKKAFRDEERAEAAYDRAVDQDARLTREVLKVEPATLSEALAKQSVFAAMWGRRTVTDLPFNEDTQLALAALIEDVQSFSGRPDGAPAPISTPCPTAANAAGEWQAACAAYLEAKAASDNRDLDEDPLWDAYAAALIRLETVPAPTAADAVFVARESIGFDQLHWAFQSVDCEDTMTDMLSGDSGEQYIARSYMTLLRLAGIDSPALKAVAHHPAFRVSDFAAQPAEFEREWREYHAARRAQHAHPSSTEAEQPAEAAAHLIAAE